MDNSRYSRQAILEQIGEVGNRRLAVSRVLIIGAGGLGSSASIYLAGAGTGHITIYDADTVSVSNLHRQVLYSEADQGLSKALKAKERLSALNSDVEIECHAEIFDASNAVQAIAGHDLVIDCTDNFATRYVIDDACAQARVPWIYGSIGETDGNVALFGGKSGVRFADLFPDRETLCSAPRPIFGVLGPLPGIIGAIQAAQAIKFLVGFGELLDGKLLHFDLLTLSTHIFEL